jgi:transketolase
MSLGFKKELELKEKAWVLRREIIKMLYHAKSGHAGGSLSAVEILLVLYYSQMRIDPDHPDWEGRDRFIASKGHCAPAIYAILADKGFIATKELESLRQLGGMLQGHPDMKKTPGIDMSTGSLGLGLSAGIGMGLASRLDNRDYFTFVLLGDGELNEGQIWEAAMAAAKFKLDNVIAILDNNGVQLDGKTDEIMPLGDICRKFEAFGWNAIAANGHDLRAMDDAIDKAKSVKGMPSIILARTVKGKGISFMEGKHEWHGMVIGDKEFEAAMSQLEGCIAL